MAEDYYKTLGVSKNASQADIQKAYRTLARKHHPDMNPNDKSAKKKFQQVQAAFDVLNNPEKREMYDRYGSSFETMGAGGPPPPGGGPQQWTWTSGGPGGGFSAEDIDLNEVLGERFGQDMPGGLGDLFGQFHRAAGKSRKSAAPRRGVDLNHELEIPFQTAVLGGEVQLIVERPSGKSEKLAVKIPAGIDEGKKIRIRGQGGPAPGRNGTPGDILITIHVAPHPCFQRHGNNLTVRVPVTLAEAVGGTKLDLPTPKGTVTLRVPPGASGGTKLRVKGHGVAPKNGTPGDLLAEIQILLPKQLSDADRQAICKIAEPYPQTPRKDLRW